MTQTERLPVACFGKLPFHREFLRIGLSSPAAGWVVRWVEGAHAAISEGREGAPTVPGPLVRFAVQPPGGRGVVAGVVRQSTDGLRRHPIALFVEEPSDWGKRAHLFPLALVEVWEGLHAFLERTCASPEEFADALRAGVPHPQIDSASASYGDALAAGSDRDPWETLTGARGDPARHFALNLLTLARAQREARSAAEGVSLVVPLAGAIEVHAALWLELFQAAGGPPSAAIALAGAPDRLYAFYRPTDGTDLAAMLGLPGSAIDDLSEPWQTLPPADARLAAAVAQVGAGHPAPLGDVLSWVRSATST